MLNWIFRRGDRCEDLEREIEALTRDLDAVSRDLLLLSDEVEGLRHQLEQSVQNMAELQVEHMRRVIALENNALRGIWS